MKIAIVVFAGLFSVALTEVVAIVWMRNAPASIDLVGNFFLMTVLPSVTMVVLIAALALWKLFATNPLRNASIYACVYLVAQGLVLNLFGNPPMDLLYYATIVACVCGAVFSLFNRFVWSEPAL
ncbi:MAG: hypothetical protein O7G86_17740 [Gammaproteobacteria bacterium]|nr:hypothetical protein [Gammaproteobacteria bacterium]MCZ6855758.1 hypothetical protein [Gammaproteobacteria bacterium]